MHEEDVNANVNLNVRLVGFPAEGPTLAQLFRQLEVHMSAQFDRINAAITACNTSIDAAVTRVTTDLSALNAQIVSLQQQLAAGGLTPEEETAVEASIAALQGKVDGNVDPSNPAPPPPPTPIPVPVQPDQPAPTTP